MRKTFILKVVLLYPVFVCLLFFLPAGSFSYWEAWVFSVVFFIPMFFTMNYLTKKDPELLKRRLKMKEKDKDQKAIVKLFRLPFFIGFLIPGFDYRFHWSEVSPVVVIIANILVFLGYLFVFSVFRENSYASRIVEVEEEQKVISTGPYAIVRHPMYTGMITMFLAMPVALGSWWALFVFGFLPVIMAFRILSEEKILSRELPGYSEYCQKTRFRLIPYIW
jgi:protein-S-isoprenylcysteine O-methyltransferase Ste14